LLQRRRPGLPRQPCRPNSGALSADMPRLGVARAGGNSAAAAAHGSVCAHVRLERIPAPTAARKPQAIYHTCVHASDRIDAPACACVYCSYYRARPPSYACMARRLYMIYASGLEHKMPTGLRPTLRCMLQPWVAQAPRAADRPRPIRRPMQIKGVNDCGCQPMLICRIMRQISANDCGRCMRSRGRGRRTS
jgi:hypothetical protein